MYPFCKEGADTTKRGFSLLLYGGRLMRVHSIFQSINGEVTASHQGSVCTFIRLQGCNLRCKFCDTKVTQSLKGGVDMSPNDVIKAIESLPVPTRNITITGGEPLLQVAELSKLNEFFQDNECVTTLETNGTIALPDPNILSFSSIVMDIKPHICLGVKWATYVDNAMKQVQYNMFATDWVKFPIIAKKDFENAVKVKEELYLENKEVSFAFSAVLPLTHKELFDWIIERKEGDVVLNVQLHKLIGVA
jgi:7-carboxy-7-deazaguanine synthase